MCITWRGDIVTGVHYLERWHSYWCALLGEVGVVTECTLLGEVT